MSFRDKAREIREAGEAQRGNFEPSGKPKEMYQYWLNNSDSLDAKALRRGEKRENFCHFWRVVAIWAPLLYLGRALQRAASHDTFWGVFGALGLILVSAGSIVSSNFRLATLVGLGIIVGLAMLLCSCWAVEILHRRIAEKPSNSGLSRKQENVVIGLGVPFFPVGVLAYLFVCGIDALVKAGPVAFATVFIVLMYTIVSVPTFLDFGWTGLAWLYGGSLALVLAIGLAVMIGIKISTYIEGSRALREQSEQEEDHSDDHGFVYEAKPKKQGGFWRGVGDFLILLAQVARVNKWKICPIVQVDNER